MTRTPHGAADDGDAADGVDGVAVAVVVDDVAAADGADAADDGADDDGCLRRRRRPMMTNRRRWQLSRCQRPPAMSDDGVADCAVDDSHDCSSAMGPNRTVQRSRR